MWTINSLHLLGVVCVAILGMWLLATMRGSARSHLPLPPGPKSLPIIGNLLDLPKNRVCQTYTKWAEDYGEIVHVSSFGQSIIILNSLQAAVDLLEKKSAIYSSRPDLHMIHLMGFGWCTTLLKYGNTWRQHRKLLSQYFSKSAVLAFHSMQTAAIRTLVRSLLDAPQDYVQHIRHATADIVMSITYGYDIAPKGDPYVDIAERTSEAFGQGVRPGAYLIDLIPLLKYVPEWVPGAGFQKFARDTREVLYKAREVTFEQAKRRISEGTARPSFTYNALSDLGITDESNDDVEIIKHVAGVIYGAGADTTVSSTTYFILAMVLYPLVQTRAQSELDSVVGRDRLPEFSDRPHLPYVNAIVKEVLRWIPVVSPGIPHELTEDDIYKGLYHIPKGAIVLAPAWATLHDEEVYTDPNTFRPERFLPDEQGNVERDPADNGAFGFGRRICPGRYMADASIWIAVASMLATFFISNAVDEEGHEIDIRYAAMEPSDGVVGFAPPFPCSFTPRSKEAERIARLTDKPGYD